MEHTIDAKDKKIGRVASEAAKILMGKNSADFQRHQVSGNKVFIINTSKATVSQKKKDEKIYKRYTGYPGGLREESLSKVIEKKGYSEAFRKAVYGMLPDNRLTSELMKNLVIKE